MGKINQVCSCVLVLILCVCLVCGQFAKSPCPGVFEYERDGGGIYGKIVIEPGSPTSQLELQVNFTVAAQVFSDYYGTLQQMNEKFALQNYNKGIPMTFRVHFPVTSPLPRVTGITVNGQPICYGPGDTLRPNQYLTTFSLQHTSFFQGGGYVPISTPEPYNPVEIDGFRYKPPEKPYVKPTRYRLPVYPPVTPEYETTTSRRKVPDPDSTSQNYYYPTYPRKPQKPTTVKYETQPQEPIEEETLQYYPPLEQTYRTPEPTTTTERTERPIQRQPQRQASAECGTRANNIDSLPLIYGGEDFERGEQPWLVAIYKKSGSNLHFKCGGTLVSNRHVISAAHCLWLGSDRSQIQDMVVKLGVHRLSDWEDDIVVTRSLIDAKIHEGYNSTTFKNDISVLVLSKEVQFNTYIRPACLWEGNTDLERIISSSGVVAGWGEQNRRGGGADIPQLVRLPIVRTEKCRASKESFVNLTSDKTFCAGDRNGSGPCRGDSGGGMYLLDGVKWNLRGVVSISLRGPDGSCNLDEYIVFTDTAKYLSWIRKVMSTSYFD